MKNDCVSYVVISLLESGVTQELEEFDQYSEAVGFTRNNENVHYCEWKIVERTDIVLARGCPSQRSANQKVKK